MLQLFQHLQCSDPFEVGSSTHLDQVLVRPIDYHRVRAVSELAEEQFQLAPLSKRDNHSRLPLLQLEQLGKGREGFGKYA